MRPRTYTLAELEALSGFNARTIVFYIAEGLLPKVGRRGRHTRYPEEVLLRLQFIARVRGVQDAGRLRPVTLSEIREVIQQLPLDELRRLAAADSDEEAIRSLFDDPDTGAAGLPFARAEDDAADRSGMLAEAARLAQRRWKMAANANATLVGDHSPSVLPQSKLSLVSKPSTHFGPGVASGDEDRRLLAEFKAILAELDCRASAASAGDPRPTRESMVCVPLGEHIALTLRNVREDDPLVDRLTEIVTRLLR